MTFTQLYTHNMWLERPLRNHTLGKNIRQNDKWAADHALLHCVVKYLWRNKSSSNGFRWKEEGMKYSCSADKVEILLSLFALFWIGTCGRLVADKIVLSLTRSDKQKRKNSCDEKRR